MVGFKVNLGNKIVKISVITPILNGEKYLLEMIDSIRTQEGDWEVIFIDDASSDGSEQIVKSYNDKRLRWFKTDLANVHKKVNLGIYLATGELFVTIGADDWFLPDAFKKVNELIGDANWLVGHSQFVNLADNDKPTRLAPAFKTSFKDIMTQPPLPNTSFFIRLDFIRKHGLKYREDLEVSGDIDFQIQVLEKDSNGVFVSSGDIFACIRDHPGTMSNTKSVLQQQEAMKIKEEWKNKCAA